MSDDTPFDLERFVAAQDPLYARVEVELRGGRKDSHWMWFIFPQLRGLGSSPRAHHFGIASLEEARAYLAHPVLGPRLRDGVGWLLGAATGDPVRILGPVDAMKLRSCLTLFEAADPSEACFAAGLEKFFRGDRDDRTLEII